MLEDPVLHNVAADDEADDDDDDDSCLEDPNWAEMADGEDSILSDGLG